MKRIVILGGSFNPVHNGHLRLALETGEALAADRVDFVPSFHPPHKCPRGLLPFELRVAALECALRDYSGVFINRFEARPKANPDEPSFSLFTLQDYADREPGAKLFFVLGLYDYAQLGNWYEWQKLARMTNLLVVPRQGGGVEDFLNISRRLFPACSRVECPAPLVCLSPRGEAPAESGEPPRLYYLPVPRLDISASLIREKWLLGKRLDFLLPACVVDLLAARADEVGQAWSGQSEAAGTFWA